MTANKTVEPGGEREVAIRLHLTNVIGMGAVRLMQSLLPALEIAAGYRLQEIYLPASGELANFEPVQQSSKLIRYKRYLPNAISRMLECTLLGGRFDGAAPLLVLGDIPIRCKARQTVFVQSSLLMRGANTGRQVGAIKYWIARRLFRLNMRYVSAFIVQTETMKKSLAESYPEIGKRIHVVALPAPDWLMSSRLKRTGFQSASGSGLRLFYPAACYPHKNHRILDKISRPEDWLVAELILTVPEEQNPNPAIAWVRCVGSLKPAEVLDAYGVADALLFLSLEESFGFPLVEAMWLGLPIICPDLPYARDLCGEGAIYFDPDSTSSLRAAIAELGARRDNGWWPDWSVNLARIPHDWQQVADAMLRLASAQGDAA